jgi:hypothetical protein
MPTLRITIKMDNAAFGDEPMTEAARILRVLSRDLEYTGILDRFVLRDLNGNTVGEAKVTH